MAEQNNEAGLTPEEELLQVQDNAVRDMRINSESELWETVREGPDDVPLVSLMSLMARAALGDELDSAEEEKLRVVADLGSKLDDEVRGIRESSNPRSIRGRRWKTGRRR